MQKHTLQSVQHQPRKRFGQHFLHDASVIQRIISSLRLKSQDRVVEIGPGLGALTRQLLPVVGHLEVIELDREVIPHLVENCAGLGDLIVHQADALRFDLGCLQPITRSLRIVGNLPYNISTPLLFHLLSQVLFIQDMHFMLQKEVVDRMVALPGTESYGRLSVMVQYYCQTESLFNVKPGAFTPPPKVESAVIRLIPYVEPPFIAHDLKLFADVVRLAFNQRRKTLRNCLHTVITAEQLQALNIDPGLRPERLGVADYVKIANHLGAQHE